MSLMFEPLRKYASFSGRARRREYWLWQVFLFLVSLFFAGLLLATLPAGWDMADPDAMVMMAQTGGAASLVAALIGLVSLALILPGIAVSVRRLHDRDMSGWWLLLGLTAVGGLVLFIFYLLDGTPGPNRHGPDPKGRPGYGS
jgi:uncharacterized membrane protein YhaH (DUF805 family)